MDFSKGPRSNTPLLEGRLDFSKGPRSNTPLKQGSLEISNCPRSMGGGPGRRGGGYKDPRISVFVRNTLFRLFRFCICAQVRGLIAGLVINNQWRSLLHSSSHPTIPVCGIHCHIPRHRPNATVGFTAKAEAAVDAARCRPAPCRSQQDSSQKVTEVGCFGRLYKYFIVRNQSAEPVNEDGCLGCLRFRSSLCETKAPNP